MEELSDGTTIALPTALIGLAAVVAGFYALSVWRLRKMDVN